MNREAVKKLDGDADIRKVMGMDVWSLKSGHRVECIQDLDEIFLCLYDLPEETWGEGVPDHC